MPRNAILSRMLDRLFASLVKGPCLNSRPHASRQRLDFTLLAKLQDLSPDAAMRDLLSSKAQATIAARVPAPPDDAPAPSPTEAKRRIEAADEASSSGQAEPGDSSGSDGQAPIDPRRRDWDAQKSILAKLRSIGEDARIYEQDTGVHALHLGYPLLSLAPGALGGSSRVLAPIAFIPLSLAVRVGHKPGVDLACRGEGIDRVMPNAALLAWLERQTGRKAVDLVHDEEGVQPWEEIRALIRNVCAMLDLPVAPDKPAEAARGTQPTPPDPSLIDLDRFADHARLTLEAVPKTQERSDHPSLHACAVLGLFPMANQALLADTQAMIEAPSLNGPVTSFIDPSVRLDAPETPAAAKTVEAGTVDSPMPRNPRRIADERLVAPADPCQSRTVAKARQAGGLVVHGPPGTGKSQTITNIIGDHLARGERVLFVCEKRTALDVVANRLEHLGLADLCAVVHDPQRDQRDLYLAIREQLDRLAESPLFPKSDRSLEKIDEELQRLHDELTQAHRALMTPPEAHGRSFHELMGQWLSIPESMPIDRDKPGAASVGLDELDAAAADLEVVFRRAQAVDYPKNPWAGCAAMTLEQYLAQPAADLRRGLASCVEDARAADATRSDDIPALDERRPLAEQARLRQELAGVLARLAESVDPALAARLAKADAESIARTRRLLQELAPHLEVMRSGPLDVELLAVARDQPPGPAAIARQIGALNEYLAVAATWHGFLHLGVRSRAGKELRRHGLPLTADAAQRLKRFLAGLRARQALTDAARQWDAEVAAAAGAASTALSLVPDDELDRTFERRALVNEALSMALDDANLEPRARAALADRNQLQPLLKGLERSAPRITALERMERSLAAIGLFNAAWLDGMRAHARAGRRAAEALAKLEDQFDDLETILRINHDLSRMNPVLRGTVEPLLAAGADAETGLGSLRREALAAEIARRLSSNPALAQIDGERVVSIFDRFRRLEDAKRAAVRESVLHRWRLKQKERLLVSTGSRLNGEGAKLRQRLFVRGSRAMRLRQVIALGQNADTAAATEEPGSKHATGTPDEGDPLFDLCPVWMASPETVAQIFPRRALFDLVVFDEASQCKLEEALPVLTRARRVVIAGDPKQLPPTRFFEATIVESDDASPENDQDLFESQQGEIEDLLAAALNLEIEESYLDVHYRSRNSDLIEFSNRQFYNGRLQAVPGHPANRTRFAPINLVRVQGVYEDRCNKAEAVRVGEIVRGLLNRAEPPSIGIACFNLAQRDLVIETLDDMALEDAAFASRLAAARERRGEGSFEGLFVKNLENVQGDERDHIIISATYGPNPEGRFYRRFGPLGMPGGGRRLNVLVTRARHEVHLVTSIPREAYLNPVPIPAGQSPNGGWLLFEYLRCAERLAEEYEAGHQAMSEAATAKPGRVVERPIEPFSAFSLALGRRLAAAKNLTCDVHWGNEGFRIDVAVHHPGRAEDVTVGVLCDFAQYARAQDPVEWDMFRTWMHEQQGWALHRVWSPQYFRDAAKSLNGVARRVDAFLAEEARNAPPSP